MIEAFNDRMENLDFLEVPTVTEAYLTQPSIYRDQLVFVSDDDLWTISLSESKLVARRLTSVKGRVRTPMICPLGTRIAYSSNQSGEFDIYLMPAEGGEGKRLTWMGFAYVVSWLSNDEIVIVSEYETQVSECYIYNVRTGMIKKLGLGPSQYYGVMKNGTRVLGRNIGDPAKWKGYRGGTAGTLWTSHGKQKFSKILVSLLTNIGAPRVSGNQIYFISDHEGVGNIYSTDGKGSEVKQLTFSKEFYVRDFSIYENKIVYQAGGELFYIEGSKKTRKLDLKIYSQWEQASIRYEQPGRYLQYGDINHDGKVLLAVVRGELCVFQPWLGGIQVLKHPEVVRVKLASFFAKGIIAVGVNSKGFDVVVRFSGKDYRVMGKALPLKSSKIVDLQCGKKWASVVNSRHEVFVTDGKAIKLVAKSLCGPINGLSWSPDGVWLAMSLADNQVQSAIYVWNSKTSKLRKLLEPVIEDHSPCFDLSGQYLYFLGVRDIVAEMAEFNGEIMIPHGVRPYVVRLSEKTPSMFLRPLQIEDSEDDGGKEDGYEDYANYQSKLNSKKRSQRTGSAKLKERDSRGKSVPVKIDFEFISTRIESFPATLGGWVEIVSTANRIFFLREDMRGAEPGGEERVGQYLYSYGLRDGEWEQWHQGVIEVIPSGDGRSLLLGTIDGVRLVSADSKPGDGDHDTRKDGWIDVQRIRLKVNPREEWRQMYLESWVLQKEHFHAPKIVDWEAVFSRYSPLVERAHTRWELSDIIRDMQGDLRTSHCYEFGGDYTRRGSEHIVGRLGAYLSWKESSRAFQVLSIPSGDAWLVHSSSPLIRVGIKVGDLIVAIDGESFRTPRDLERSLEFKAFKKVSISWKSSGKLNTDTIIPISDLLPLNYRVWVDHNRRLVHSRTEGRVGYVHIPDMGLEGFSEFMRGFLPESQKEALLIDARYNKGGFASEFILRYLTQTVIGKDFSQRGEVSKTYPFLATKGPRVCITNEFAGSDGDIFCHAFKRLKLGTLIGTRTWGGTIGIWPRLPLVDGTITSQPEFVFHFDDVGNSLENRGTSPDIEVTITPDDWANHHDTQLERGIIEILKLMPNPSKNRK